MTAILRLDDEDRFSMDFLKFAEKKILRRRLTFDGEQRVDEPRQ